MDKTQDLVESLLHWLLIQLPTEKVFISCLPRGKRRGYRYSWAIGAYSPTCRQLHIYRRFLFPIAYGWSLTRPSFPPTRGLQPSPLRAPPLPPWSEQQLKDMSYSQAVSGYDWVHHPCWIKVSTHLPSCCHQARPAITASTRILSNRHPLCTDRGPPKLKKGRVQSLGMIHAFQRNHRSLKSILCT